MGTPPASEPIQAYYKLVFPHFEYYLQTLSVTIGRRPTLSPTCPDDPDVGDEVIPPAPPSVRSSDHHPITDAVEAGDIPFPSSPHPSHLSNPPASSSSSVADVDLGPLKSVSRLHARIDYDERLAAFVLAVLGRNGAWVDGEWVGCGGRVALGARTKIQIATRSFYFVLPPPVGPASAGAVSSLSEHPAQKSQLALTSSIRHSAPPSPNVHELPWPGSSMLDSLSIPNSPVHQDFSPSSDPELDDALVSIDDLAPEEQDQFKNAPHDSDSELASHRKPGTLPKILPNGKGAQTGSLSTMSKVATQSKVPILPKLSSRSKPKAAKSQPAQPPQERPPPEQMPPKPPYTYAILCYRAIAAHNGQASLSEIVSWIRDEFEWYRWNDECGWESSVRHNLSSNPAFVKDRRENLPQVGDTLNGKTRKSKGFFWSVDPKSEESFKEKEKELREMGLRAKSLGKGKGKEKDEGIANTMVPVPGLSVSNSSFQQSLNQGSIPRARVLHVQSAMHPTHIGIPVPPLMPPTLSVPAGPSRPPTHLFPPSATLLQAPTQSSTMTDVCLPIIVGPPPTSAGEVAPASTSSSVAPFTDGPPITLHSGRLYLNPTIFSGLTTDQLAELQRLKAAKALEILQGYIKSFLKEQMMRKQGRGRGKLKAGKASTPSSDPVGSSSIPSPSLPTVTQSAISSSDPSTLHTLASHQSHQPPSESIVADTDSTSKKPADTPINNTPTVAQSILPSSTHPTSYGFYSHLPHFSHFPGYGLPWSYAPMSSPFVSYPRVPGMTITAIPQTASPGLGVGSGSSHGRVRSRSEEEVPVAVPSTKKPKLDTS